MQCKFARIVDVGLICWFGGRRDEGACYTIFAEGGVEDNIMCKFVNKESGEDVLNGVVETASLIEVLKESLRGSGWSEVK